MPRTTLLLSLAAAAALTPATAQAQNILADVIDTTHGTAAAASAPLTIHTGEVRAERRTIVLDAECPAGPRRCTCRLELLSLVPSRPLAAVRVDFAPGERRAVALRLRRGLRGRRIHAVATLRPTTSGPLNGRLVTVHR